jgi:hypothetical protein
VTPAVPSTPDNLAGIRVAIQAVGYVVTWIIVCIGWFVNNKQNRSRDERKELRDQINDIADVIRNVESDAVAYLTHEGNAPTASFWTVYFGVRRVHSTIVRDPIFETDATKLALIEYRKALTDRAMPGPSATAKSPVETNRDLQHVSSSGNALIKTLEENYSVRYPRKK